MNFLFAGAALNSLQGDLGLWGLFLSAFISSTLLPGGSELALAYLVRETSHSPVLLIAVATAGNTLGGMTSWLIGWLIAARFPLKALEKREHQVAAARIRRWGSPVLLLSWLPVVGDPLCVVAGWLRIHVLKALIFIALGKLGRYAAIVWLLPNY